MICHANKLRYLSGLTGLHNQTLHSFMHMASDRSMRFEVEGGGITTLKVPFIWTLQVLNDEL